MLPYHPLLARAFHRPAARSFSVSAVGRKGEGGKGKEHVTEEGDSHNGKIYALEFLACVKSSKLCSQFYFRKAHTNLLDSPT
jgi:hypothetical protein